MEGNVHWLLLRPSLERMSLTTGVHATKEIVDCESNPGDYKAI